MLYEFYLKESLSDYLCPKCGAEVTSGIPHPLGDYDEWLVQPHCSQCGFETCGGKDPFAECVPPDDERVALGVVVLVVPGLPPRPLLYDVNKPAPRSVSAWGMGGRMYDDAVLVPIPAEMFIIRQGNETTRAFRERASVLAQKWANEHETEWRAMMGEG